MNRNSLSIGIIGVGYVGLPLATAFSQHVEVIAFDTDNDKVKNLNNGIDLNIVGTDKNMLENDVIFTNTLNDLIKCNVYIICVPTPINSDFTPDLSLLTDATSMVSSLISKGDTVIFESSVWPGATREICFPIMQSISNLEIDVDFVCGYSPERISPGVNGKNLPDIVKLVSASSPNALTFISELYSMIIPAGVYECSSIEIAEASKILENTQRDVNIALMNEFSSFLLAKNIPIGDVMEAANTKWNFNNYYPGLVGGHCIPIDPCYLLKSAHDSNISMPLIESSRLVNESMVNVVVLEVIKILSSNNIQLRSATILIMGLAFKENCNDTRNSKVFHLISMLQDYGIDIDVYDPLLDHDTHQHLIPAPDPTNLKYNLLIKCVNHFAFSDFIIDILNNRDYSPPIYDITTMALIDNH